MPARNAMRQLIAGRKDEMTRNEYGARCPRSPSRRLFSA